MAFTVENGTGLAAANSYLSEADADTYFTDRGSPAAWTGATSANKEAALIYASQWIDGRFDFVGEVQTLTQGLKWPRASAYDSEGRLESGSAVPARIEAATAELALLHLGTALNSTFARGGQVTREKIGPIDVQYADGAPVEKTFPHVARILEGLLAAGPSNVVVTR